jgi:hypothetical protein
MQIPPMRPTFRIEFPLEDQEAIHKLSTLLDDADFPISGRIAGNHLMLVIPPESRHFWSPWLNIEVYQLETGSAIKGRFSPNPSVWTGFMFTYISLATLSFFAAMFGVAQWMMNKPPAAAKLIPLFIILAVLIYWASLIGQKFAQAQMHELYDVSMGALGGIPDQSLSS